MNNNNNNSSNRLYIGNLPPNSKPDVVRDMLSNVGITPIKLVLRKNHALIDLPENITTEAAIPMLNGMYTQFYRLLYFTDMLF